MPSIEDVTGHAPKPESTRPAPPTLEASRELLNKLNLQVPTPAELEQAKPILEKLARIEKEELHLADFEGKRRWDSVIAGYGPLIAAGDLAGARKMATEAFFPVNDKQQHICFASLNATRGKLRTELSAIVEKVFQRTAPVVEKALASFEASDRNFAFTSGFEMVQYRQITLAARAWPQHGQEAVNQLFMGALSAPRK